VIARHELLTAAAVRKAASRMMQDAHEDRLQYWTVDIDALPAVAEYVSNVTRQNYPALDMSFHSRWRHFSAGGIDRWAILSNAMGKLDTIERARRSLDLVIMSVLTDAGAGSGWAYFDSVTRKRFSASEGLALASLELYRIGTAASAHEILEAGWLAELSEAQFASAFQVTTSNPLTGVSGRVELLRSLGRVCSARPEMFAAAGAARPGGLVDVILANDRNGSITAPEILEIVLDALGSIWPSRASINQIALGDSWLYRPWVKNAEPDASSIVPFHKLSQWLTYSLIEPLQSTGLIIEDIDGLTGLAEYRNGGLFIDCRVLKPRDTKLLESAHNPDSEIVIEWRAMTVALLDILKPLVAEQLGFPPTKFSLPYLLEGGTWAAGRRIAQERRGDASPPVKVISDGTVF
jgi:Protein of unknown function (DUF1688)